MTHVIWDSFTHDSAFVRSTPRTQPAPSRLTTRSRTVTWIVVLASGLAVAIAIWVSGVLSGRSPLENTVVYVTVVVGIAVAGLLAIIATLLWHRRRVVNYSDRITATTLPRISA